MPILSVLGLASLGGLFVVAQGLLALALTIAGLITAVVMRPFFSQPGIEAWIDHSHAFWPDPASQDEIAWHGRLCAVASRPCSMVDARAAAPAGPLDQGQTDHDG